MPSYQIVKISKTGSNLNIDDLIQTNKIFSKLNSSLTSESLKLKLQHVKKNHRNLVIKKSDWEKCKILEYENNPNLPNYPDVWISQKLNLLLFNPFFFIGKSSSYLDEMIAKYISLNGKAEKILLNRKKLWTFYKRLRPESIKKCIKIEIHRIILRNTFLDSSKINELNIQAKNVADVDQINELIKESQEIKAITLRFYFNQKDYITIRIDKSANVLIYGNPSTELIENILNSFTTSLWNLV